MFFYSGFYCIRKWLWNPAIFQGTETARFLFCFLFFFWAHTFWLIYVAATFLLASSSGTNHDLLWFVHGQGQKPKRWTKNFAKLQNHLPPLTLLDLAVNKYPLGIKLAYVVLHTTGFEWNYINEVFWNLSTLLFKVSNIPGMHFAHTCIIENAFVNPLILKIWKLIFLTNTIHFSVS